MSPSGPGAFSLARLLVTHSTFLIDIGSFGLSVQLEPCVHGTHMRATGGGL